MRLFSRTLSASPNTVIVILSLFWASIANAAFFKHVVGVYTFSTSTAPFILSLWVLLVNVSIIVLTLLSWRPVQKFLWILLLMVTSFVAYFMDTYDIVVDGAMIENILQTNLSESLDLFSLELVAYVGALGLIPSFLIYAVSLENEKWKTAVISKAKLLGITLIVTVAVLGTFNKNYASFFREHKPLRYYANPSFYLYSMVHYVQKNLKHDYTGLTPIGLDAKIDETDGQRELIILVVGEAARWDHFSLNGYGRKTNPLLENEDIINFSNFTSCGTETAVSVPCMFSSFGRENYEKNKARHTENLIDILMRAGVNVLWRDNNSDSKGVALRAQYEDFKKPDKNTICDEGECRDEGMLVGLQEYIDAHPKGDIVIVLHQMGNHGPAYYKRYPKEFEKFTPVCRNNQLEKCSEQEIVNAYDNAILYTDYFLSKVIALLKKNDHAFETAMYYVSDHGESLGEMGLYLHGFPYAIAPETQKHVAAMMWFGKRYAVDRVKLKQLAKMPQTHDSYFHTVLNMTEINSTVYNSRLDILHGLH